jgi:signal transduction histidine kinase
MPAAGPGPNRPSFGYALYLFLVLAVLLIILLVNGYLEVQRTRRQLFNLLETEGHLLIRNIGADAANLLERFLAIRDPGAAGFPGEAATEEFIGLEDLLIERLVDLGLRLDQIAARRSEGPAGYESLIQETGLAGIVLVHPDSQAPAFLSLKKDFRSDPAFRKLLSGDARLFVFRNEAENSRPYKLLVAVARRFEPGLVILTISGREYRTLAYESILQGLLNEFSGKGNLAYLEVVDSRGRVLARTGRNDLLAGKADDWRRALPEKKTPIFWIKRGPEEFLEMRRLLEPAGPSGGVARLGLSLNEINPLLHHSRQQVLFMTAILLALGMASLMLIFKVQGRQFQRIREMEEQMRLQEELSSMGQLAAGVAHEIKNPLNAIGLVVQRLQQEFTWADPKMQQDYDRFTRIVRDEIGRVNRIIEQFLFVARPYQAEREEQALGEILDYVLALMEEEFREKKIILERPGQGKPFFVRGDRFQLTQALINVINNAVEAMPGGGTLRIDFAEAANPAGIEIRVRDSGQGISPENRKHLFAHYFTTKEKGVGLGLAITRKIIEGHGGAITLESEPGRGTNVILRLPRVPPPVNLGNDPK